MTHRRQPHGGSNHVFACLHPRQSRRVDQLAQQEFGFSGLVLMENAGRGVADVLCRLGIAGTVVICCGKGNNAGDGFVIARHLDLRGHKVRVLLWAEAEELTGDAATNYQDPLQDRRADRGFRGRRKRGQVQFVRTPSGPFRQIGPVPFSGSGLANCWKVRLGSLTACWAPAPAANRARRWTR